jgi:nicotinamide-nucleotide adenylyltransferase
MIGLIIGRFQPMHLGHLELIKLASAECEIVFIIIGSPEKHNEKNPFSITKRKNMMKRVLKKNKISNYKIFTLKDIPQDSRWVGYVKENLPKFDIVYSGDKKDLDLWNDAGLKMKSIGRIGGISATKIRERMRNKDDSWKELVP